MQRALLVGLSAVLLLLLLPNLELAAAASESAGEGGTSAGTSAGTSGSDGASRDSSSRSDSCNVAPGAPNTASACQWQCAHAVATARHPPAVLRGALPAEVVRAWSAEELLQVIAYMSAQQRAAAAGCAATPSAPAAAKDSARGTPNATAAGGTATAGTGPVRGAHGPAGNDSAVLGRHARRHLRATRRRRSELGCEIRGVRE